MTTQDNEGGRASVAPDLKVLIILLNRVLLACPVSDHLRKDIEEAINNA